MHVYCSGIGGVGIGPLAMLALDAGYEVSGSDLSESDMTRLLESRGARIAIGQDGSQIAKAQSKKPIDWFVYSAALPSDHAELTFAKTHNIRTSKRDAFINQILDDKQLKLIAVSGTHGKTTTTGMITWLFKALNIPVSYAIGTTVSFGPPAIYDPKSEYFVYECDEFDRNFLSFKPSVAVIPSVDYDHSDTYPTQADYNYAFADFVNQSQHTLLWQRDADKLELADSTAIEIFGDSDPGIANITLAGEHNRRNGWLALQTVHQLYPQLDEVAIADALVRFPGTNRRFEKLAENLYTDYAHHPVEIAATVQAARELSDRVVIVYQPHQNIRQHEIVQEGGYKGVFTGAKRVYWLPTYLSREQAGLEVLSPENLIRSLTDPSLAEPTELDDALLQKIKDHQANGDLVLAMSAGDLDPWLRQHLV